MKALKDGAGWVVTHLVRGCGGGGGRASQGPPQPERCWEVSDLGSEPAPVLWMLCYRSS